MNPIIREYNKLDQDACMESFISNVPMFFAENEIQDFENFLVSLDKEEIKTHFYVVVYDGKIIGCGGFGDKDNTGMLSLAWGLIHKDYHKKGLGEKLLTFRLEQIKKLKPGLPLVVDTSQHAYSFFEKFGFVTTKITNDYYAIGMHRYDMVYEKQD